MLLPNFEFDVIYTGNKLMILSPCYYKSSIQITARAVLFPYLQVIYTCVVTNTLSHHLLTKGLYEQMIRCELGVI